MNNSLTEKMRPLAELAADNAVPGASGAQRLSVQEVLGASTGATTQCTSAVELCERSIENAASSPQNMGEMAAADAIGTVGSTNCGDMLRLWIKFKDEKDGRRVIDRATFQSFGCQTAIAVASVATELIRGKTAEEALSLSGEELSAPLGALPPMKIHCAQLVEQALQSALAPTTLPPSDDKPSCSSPASTLSDQLHPQTGKFKINILPS